MLSLPSRSTKLIHVKARPEDLILLLSQASNDQFTIHIKPERCNSCGSSIRQNASPCWACGSATTAKSNVFTVKLSKSWLEESGRHGFTGALLCAWNPGSLTLRVSEFGYGSRLEINLVYKLSLAEIGVFILFCALLSWGAIAMAGTGTVQLIKVMLLFLLGPVLWIIYRRSEDKRLLEFVSKRLPELLSDRIVD